MSAASIIAFAIAGASVLVTFTIGIWSFRSARALNDLEGVRDVLDDAAVKLHEVEYAIIECWLGLSQQGASFFEDPTLEAAHSALGSRGRQLDALFERLRIRFPQTDDVVVAFKAANQATRSIYLSLQGLKGEINPLDEVKTMTADERKRFDVERGKFIDAAQRAAGVRLRLLPAWRAPF